MTELMSPRGRKVRILATLGPASDTPEMIARLMLAGADAFRINMSHGSQADKAEAGRGDSRARGGIWPPDDDPVRPAGA